jgi:hypothetical protein
MINKSWNELNHHCPIDLTRIMDYAQEMESAIPKKINLENLNKSKEDVLSARGSFDLMVVTLIQVLHDRSLLETNEDKILFGLMVDNLGRYLGRLDDEEFDLIIKMDEPDPEKSLVGISRISTYSKLLSISCDLLYESILKATNEYVSFEGTDKIKKEKRIFLYMIFQILQVTFSVIGGFTREKRSGISKKGTMQIINPSWQGLLGRGGQDLIKKEYEDRTGVPFPEEEIEDDTELEGEIEDEDSEEN